MKASQAVSFVISPFDTRSAFRSCVRASTGRRCNWVALALARCSKPRARIKDDRESRSSSQRISILTIRNSAILVSCNEHAFALFVGLPLSGITSPLEFPHPGGLGGDKENVASRTGPRNARLPVLTMFRSTPRLRRHCAAPHAPLTRPHHQHRPGRPARRSEDGVFCFRR